jgi:hypothetical protein
LITPKSGEAKDRPANTCVSEFNSLFGERHAKPISAFALKPSRTLNRAVAVSVGLNDRHHFNCRSNLIFDDVEVCCQRIEVDL